MKKKKLAQCNLAEDMGPYHGCCYYDLATLGFITFLVVYRLPMRNLYIVAVEPPKIANIVST